MDFTSQFFTQNRRKLIEQCDKPGLIVVPGNGRMQRSADTAFPFRQDSNFYYLTGINEPCATLFIDTASSEEWIMLPLRSGVQSLFDGHVDNATLTHISGIESIVSEQASWHRLKQYKNALLYIPQKPKSIIGEMYMNPHRARVFNKLSRLPLRQAADIRPYLAKMRSIKASVEIAAIEKAIDITNNALAYVAKNAVQYDYEYQLEAEISKQFRFAGAQGHAYAPIVASGASSCTLHYVDNNHPLHTGEVVLLDIGAEVNNYAADVSRTFVHDQKPTARQNEVLVAVAEAQAEIIALLKPGLNFKELATLSDEIIAHKLTQLGLIGKKHTSADVRKYFPHSISHFLGLDVHDVGDYSQPLAPGMVITVEPGIYIQDESLGVRIEDDVVITKNGARVLGDGLPALV